MRKTDKGKVEFPTGISAGNRRKFRSMIVSVANVIQDQEFSIACSGGLDSTVLAHVAHQACIINGNSSKKYLIHINHQFRTEEETTNDREHVQSLCTQYDYEMVYREVNPSDHTQDAARIARYDAFKGWAATQSNLPTILMAHHANDVVESKLFQFLTGRVVGGIAASGMFSMSGKDVFSICRPLLKFTREDLDTYAKAWHLSWSEDSSNCGDDFTRNKIRHHLIPWITENVNSGIIKTLGRN